MVSTAMTGRPLVSIIIPARNAELWIADTIDSCLRQTWQNIEIIVADDGSLDRTSQIVRGFHSSSVRALKCERPGASAARNTGIAASRGDFIQFLDADDVLDPEKIEIQLECLPNSPGDTIASGAWSRFIGSPGERPLTPDTLWRDLAPEEFLIESWTGGGMMPVFGWLTPRAVIEKAGPWNEQLSVNDDGEFFARAVLASSGIVFCPQAKGYYRVTESPSISKGRGRAAMLSALHAIDMCSDHLLNRNASAAARHACACQYQRFAFSYYPECVDLVRRAEQHAHELGGCDLKCEGGEGFQLAAGLAGWKFARHLQRFWHRSSSRFRGGNMSAGRPATGDGHV
jgi:glycosyltransferase involved in cell wall biosynthesis